MRTSPAIVLGLALTGVAVFATLSSARTPPAANAPAAANPALKEFIGGGVTIRLGTPKAEIMAQMAKNKGAQWFVQDLDSAPTDELLKMDKWVLSYSNGPGATPGGGVVTLVFVSDKVSKILKGAQ